MAAVQYYGSSNAPGTFAMPPSQQQSRSAFDKIQDEAAAEFAEITGQNIRGISIRGMDDVMGLFAKFNEPVSDEEEHRKARTKLIVQGVLTGLHVLNGVAAQAASGIFPHSNACFNAVGWLLTIPNKISELNDGIGGLFSTIDDYLVRFKVLKTVDQMDPESVQDMVQGTGAIMKSFVKICALCYKKWAGSKRERAKLIFKAVFADEGSRVKGELASFEKLLSRQEALTGAVTLKAVVSTKKEISSFKDVTESIKLAIVAMAEQVDEIGMTTKATDLKVDNLGATAKSTENKVDVTKEGVEKLVKDLADRDSKKAIDKEREDLSKFMNPGGKDEGYEGRKLQEELDNNRKQVLDTKLPGSGEWLKVLPEYKTWRDQASSEHVLLLSGSPGCGKNLLASQIWDDFELENSREIQFLIAYHQLSGDSDKDLGQEAVVEALKKMALQLSEKNPAYRRDLLSSCRSSDGRILKGNSPTIEDVWRLLKLGSSSIKSNYIFVLIFEDFHRLTSAAAQTLSKMFTRDDRDFANRSDNFDKARFRVLVTGETGSTKISSLRCLESQPNVVINEHNRPDIELYIQSQLQNDVFTLLNKQVEEGSDAELTKAFREKLPVAVSGSFTNVLLKMRRLEAVVKADEDDESFSLIKRLLSDRYDVDRNTIASAAIEKLNSSLNDIEIKQLNTILQWLVYGTGTFEISMLESIISLAGIKTGSRLQSFADKVRNSEKFGRILKTRTEYGRELVEVDEEVLAYLKDQYHNSPNDVEGKDISRGLITMKITFDRAKPDDMKAFFFRLHNTIDTNYDIFPMAQQVQAQEGIRVDPNESYQVIVEQALEILTDLPDYNSSMVWWAVENLPKHLDEDAMSANDKTKRITFTNRKRILRGLVSLLTDVELTAKHWRTAMWITSQSWLKDEKTLKILESWLRDEVTARELKPKYNRRLKKLLGDNPGPGGIWKPLTLQIAQNWLVNGTDEDSWPMEFHWIDNFITMQKRLSKKAEGAQKPMTANPDEKEDGGDPKPGILRARTTLSIADDVKPLHRSQTDLADPDQSIDHRESKTFGLETPNKADDEQTGSAKTVVDDDDDDTAEQPSPAEKVRRSAAWAEKELEITDLNATWYERLGRSYYIQSAYDEGIDCLEEGIANFPYEPKLRDWLVVLYKQQGRPKKAIVHLRVLIGLLEKAEKQKDNSEKRVALYERLGNLLFDAGNKDEALQTFTKALDLKPDDYPLRMTYLKLLSDSGNIEEVSKFLTEAEHGASTYDELGQLSCIFYDIAESDPVGLITKMLAVFVRCQKLELALRAVEKSLDFARGREDFEPIKIVPLMNFKATLLTLGNGGIGSSTKALEEWTAAGDILAASDERGWFQHSAISALRSCHMIQSRQGPIDNDLAVKLEQIGRSQMEANDYCPRTLSYLSYVYVKLGQKEKAKELFVGDMKQAFEILSNDDSYDDWIGYMWMADIFEHLGEDENALTAYSLIGPNTRKHAVANGAKNVNGDGGLVDQPETATDSEDAEESNRTGPWNQECDGSCGKAWTYADDFVRCKACPQTIFCRDCHQRLRNGKPDFCWCHSDHEFLDVPPWPEEDWPHGKSRVQIGGWGNKGGKVVDITEWLDTVRVQWGIEEPKHYDIQDKRAKSKSRTLGDGEDGESQVTETP